MLVRKEIGMAFKDLPSGKKGKSTINGAIDMIERPDIRESSCPGVHLIVLLPCSVLARDCWALRQNFLRRLLTLSIFITQTNIKGFNI